MSDIKKFFTTIFEPEMKRLDFGMLNGIFHKKLSDQILILLANRTYASGHEITVQFEIVPFCYGVAMSPRFTDYNLTVRKLFPETEFLIYDKQDTERISEIFHELLTLCKDKVFPLFEVIIDYRSYIEFEKKFGGIDALIETKKYSFNVYLPLVNYIPVLLALKDYDNAKLALESSIYDIKYGLGRDQDRLDERHPRFSEYMERVKYNEHLIDLIASNDENALQKIVSEKERFARDAYYRNFSQCTICRRY